MVIDQVRDQSERRAKNLQDVRLALIGKDPDLVRTWFPEWFPAKTLAVKTAADVEEIIDHAMEGGSSVWTAGETDSISPEEMEALLQTLTQGSAALPLPDTGWE